MYVHTHTQTMFCDLATYDYQKPHQQQEALATYFDKLTMTTVLALGHYS